MRRTWNDHVFGHVKATVTGRLTEVFINRCMKEGIAIWDISRINGEQIRCSLLIKDAKQMKKILKETNCRIHFEQRLGLPFIARRLMSRAGILGGLATFLLVLLILSNMVWRVDVTGADGKVEDHIQKILGKMNVHVGSVVWFLPSIEKIENQLSRQLDKVTWVGVSKNGTTYKIDVVQKELPKKEKETGPRDLVSTKEGTITKVYVEKGEAQVETNDYVSPGTVLISGMIGGEKDPKFVSAKGKVMAETWYNSEINVPMNTEYVTFTGETYTGHKIEIFGWDFPVWGLDNHPFKNQDKEVIRKQVQFLFWDLPIDYKKVIYKETDGDSRKLTKKEATKLGLKISREQLLNKLSQNAKVLSHEIESAKVEDGVLNLVIFYRVEEEITKPKTFLPKQRQEEMDQEKDEEEEN